MLSNVESFSLEKMVERQFLDLTSLDDVRFSCPYQIDEE